jgi:hypothetical protein
LHQNLLPRPVLQYFKNVAIFATFALSVTCQGQKTLPNQGLERKIARKLSGLFREWRSLVAKL